MIRILLFITFLFLCALGGNWLLEHNGALAITWLGYNIETSLAFAILAFVVLTGLATFLTLAVYWLYTAPRRYRNYHSLLKKDRGLVALTRGFACIASGDVANAKKLIRQAEAGLGETSLTLLLRMQAAQLEGDDTSTERYLSMLLDNKDTELIGLKGLLLQAQKKGDVDEAYTLAERANRLNPHANWVTPVLSKLYIQNKQWSLAIDALRGTVKRQKWAGESLKRQYGILQFAQCLKAKEAGDFTGALHYAESAYRYIPDFVPLTVAYAYLLLNDGGRSKALKLLLKIWKRHPHPTVVPVYLSAYLSESAEKKVQRIEQLTKTQPNHPDSHLAIAQQCIEAGFYSKARNHLKVVITLRPSMTAYSLLAEIEKRENASPDIIQEWLSRAATAPKDSSWICGECHYDAALVWTVNCKQCDAFDSLIWQTPQLLPRTSL